MLFRRRPKMTLRPLLEGVERPFDQTNGTIRDGVALPFELNTTAGRLLATGVAVNAVAFGTFGGGL